MKIGCTGAIWEKAATMAAIEAGLDPAAVLAGNQNAAHVRVRWTVWRDLVARGYSYFSIGNASGFHHTTVRNASQNREGPYSGLWVSQKRRPQPVSKMVVCSPSAAKHVDGVRPSELEAV